MDSIPAFIVLTVCLVGVLGQCPSGWKQSSNYCYYFNNNDTVSWSEANNECKIRFGALLRIEDTDEYNFIKSNMAINPSGYGFWTALNDRDPSAADPDNSGTGTWLWGNDEGVLNIVTNNWDQKPDNNPLKACVAINLAATLSNLQCSTKSGYICELDNNGDGCPMGWLIGPTDCFWVSNVTDPTQLLTWDAANTKCQQIDTGGQGTAHLLTLNNMADSSYFAINMPSSWSVQTTTLWWTDLTDRSHPNKWYWANNDVFNPSYVNWTKEPDNIAGREHCGTILQKGTFGDRNCKQANNYICRKELPGHAYTTKFGCGDWIRAGHKCYQVYNKPMKSWSDAKSFCSGIGGRLMQLETQDEMNWLSYESQTTRLADSGYWIGLTNANTNKWTWTDGQVADNSFLKWNQQPDDYNGDQDCAIISVDGVFSDNSCKLHKSGYVCEKPKRTSNCPTNWIGHSTRCYYISNKWATFLESVDKCKSLSGDGTGYLLAVNTQDELTFLQSQFSKLTKAPFYFWTSLTDVVQEGLWVYTNAADNTPTSHALIKWNGEPNNFGGNEHCVAAAYGSRLNDQRCALKTGYICEKHAAGSGTDVSAMLFSKLILVSLVAMVTSRNN